MNKKLYSRLLLASLLVFTIQCSPGNFKSDSASTVNGNNNNNGGGNGAAGGAADAERETRRRELEKQIDEASAPGFASSTPGVPVITFDRVQAAYLIRVPMVLSILQMDMTFPEYPEMRLYSENLTVQGNLKPFMTVLIPVKYVLRNVISVPTRLPNGDRLPSFAAGEGPSNAILLTPNKERKVYLYLSAEAFAVFAETSFNPVPTIDGITLTLPPIPITANGDSTRYMGSINMVAEKGPYKGGFFLSHRLDPKLGKILDEYYLH